MIRINLLPVRVSRKKLAGKQQLLLFALVVVLGIVVNAVWNQARVRELKGRQAKLARTRDEIAQLDRIIGEVKDIKQQQQQLKEKLAILEKLKAARSGPVRMLDELATVVPKKVELRKLEEKGGAVTFDGSAASIDDVSAFMSALKTSKYFTGVELTKTTATTRGRYRIMDFVITATVDYAPQVAAGAQGAAGGPGGAQPPGLPQR